MKSNIAAIMDDVQKYLPDCEVFLAHGKTSIVIKSPDNIYGFLCGDTNGEYYISDGGNLTAFINNDSPFISQTVIDNAEHIASTSVSHDIEITADEFSVSLCVHNVEFDCIKNKWDEYVQTYILLSS